MNIAGFQDNQKLYLQYLVELGILSQLKASRKAKWTHM